MAAAAAGVAVAELMARLYAAGSGTMSDKTAQPELPWTVLPQTT
jgi:hypothetical protein